MMFVFIFTVVGHLDLDTAYQFSGLIHRQAVSYAGITDTRTAQCRQMSSGTERCADITGKRTDICAFRTHYPYAYAVAGKTQQLYAVDYKHFGFQVDFASFAG
jgi:hypothetical protein